MELLVPQSLLIAVEKTTDIKITIETFVYNLDLVFKTMAKYEADHNSLPTEWTIFQHDMRTILYKLQAEQSAISKESFIATVLPLTLETKRLEWTIKLLHADIGYTESELRSLSMIELRDLFEEEFPSTITTLAATATGGLSKKVTHIKKPV